MSVHGRGGRVPAGAVFLTNVLRNRLYYFLKPIIPQAFRMGIRRCLAVCARQKSRDTWPIMPGSEKPPQGWQGWPEKKQFALLLTHDVETAGGVEKCRRLMELEMRLGFRSSFNFIPEGSYAVPPNLLSELVQKGFEVGVHDLNHDGHLFNNRNAFRKRAARINSYLHQWNAVGFRSGFMLHNLNWLHELNITYDSSTFDTDPFEPQPHGRNTIFPFWVRRSHSTSSDEDPRQGMSDYLELPYTLPQDSTLFLVLSEKTPEIWLRKLDWVAQHGGMALVNVHPDYLRFSGEAHSSRTYPVAHYEELLRYVRTRYDGVFWHATPREIASSPPVVSLRGVPGETTPKRVCMVTHSFYESDNRVTRYAEALSARGDHVEVFALRRSADLPMVEIIQGVQVFRIQDRFGKNERSKFGYLWPLLRFLKTSGTRVAESHSRSPYDLFHIHNVPDFMVFAGWWPKKNTGASIILDIHDIVPEFFASKFGVAGNGLVFTLLCWMERISASIADHIIIANDLWIEKYGARTGARSKCCVFINNVDTQVFQVRPRARQSGKLLILFPGGLQWHQGLDVALHAFHKVVQKVTNVEFHIYGDGIMKPSLIALAEELELEDKVRFFDPLPVRKIAEVMSNADLGVVPKRADSFGNEAYSTKIMEFMASGVPVVISSTEVDRFYFNDSVVRFFDSGDADSLARQMIDLLSNREMRLAQANRALAYADENSWERQKRRYLDLVDSLPLDHSSSRK